jgi:hypothetical protein
MNVIMLIDVMSSVIMMIAVMLNVVAPQTSEYESTYFQPELKS